MAGILISGILIYVMEFVLGITKGLTGYIAIGAIVAWFIYVFFFADIEWGPR